MSLIREVSDCLQQGSWSFVLQEAIGRIKLNISGEGISHSIELQVREDTKLIIGMLTYKRKCDANNRHRMVIFMNRQNFELSLGGFEMDPTSGKVRYRNSVDVESLQLTEVFVNNFVRAIAVHGCKFWDPIEMVMDGKPLVEIFRQM
jgi:hypothetical protein